MIDNLPTKALVIRLATTEDIPCIEQLDSLSTSPTRAIHREIEKYFGSVDPSTHEHTFIFLAEIEGIARAKAELMLPPVGTTTQIGYIKRVVVHPDYRSKGLARLIIQHVINFARVTYHITALDLLVWEGNLPAIQLYESLGFKLQHRELYYRLDID